MQYIQVAEDWFLTKKSFKFKHISDIHGTSTIEVPLMMWKNPVVRLYQKTIGYTGKGSGSPRAVTWTWKSVYDFFLKDCHIEFNSDLMELDLSWISKQSRKHNTIRLVTIPFRSSTGTVKELITLSHECSIFCQGSSISPSRRELSFRVNYSKFEFLEGLPYPSRDFYPFNNFQCGMLPRQVKVAYKGKELGSCYAFLFQSCAILLGDDFSFDSLVALEGIHNGVLQVQHFFYSVNPYCIKVVTLLG